MTWWKVELDFKTEEEPPTDAVEFLLWLRTAPLIVDRVSLKKERE